MGDIDEEISFLRFFGRRSLDEDDQKDARVIVGQGKTSFRPDGQLLQISNRFGVLFAATNEGFQWAWLTELRAACEPGRDPANVRLTTVACAKPFVLQLNRDSTVLALLTDEEPASVLCFDTSAVLRGG